MNKQEETHPIRHTPTEAEYEAMKAKIRESWSKQEELDRRVGSNRRVRVQMRTYIDPVRVQAPRSIEGD